MAVKDNPNRRDMPCDIFTKNQKRGDFEIWSVNNILCLKWKDNKDIHVLSSKDAAANVTATRKL
jgi:hypothetical protein